MTILYIVLALLAILSIILLTGHGAFLIAGYNTSSSEEKAKYDTKKLCRTVGVMLLLITIATAGLLIIPAYSALATPYLVFYFIFLLADVGVTLYYTNKKCFKEGFIEGESSVDEISADTKKKKSVAVIIGICVVVLPVILLVSILLYQAGQPPVFTITDDALTISCSFGETIPLSDIKGLQMKDSLPQDLQKTNGSNFGAILKGRFKAEGSEAQVYINAANPRFSI
ncbi:DUF3784 domain-containing protein [Acetanaerobacterium elongatum]|uniref:DUF3784 domain-containing protein n=1 Tax=Acetanaerobacterium elongatum TaxID=258515 RepID=A0A1H0ET99_9FIRM|nr:DUF3784 domain-containing protein [Acetanaerobacterium elongatum]SDN85546.1 protein of unknown function [Acetanaerobacterium elongatum]